MLRPYLAVIHDSFRAALHSRVLYIMLGLIGLALIALAPLHLRQQTDWELNRRQHFVNPPRLAKRLIDEGQTGKRSAVAHVWNQLSTDVRQQLEKAAVAPEEVEDPDDPGPPGRAPVYGKLAGELNVLMSDRGFYDEEAFAGKRLTEEAVALRDKGVDTLSDLELKRFNRLLLSTALRRDIAPPRQTRLNFYYGPWRWKWLETGVSQAQLASSVSASLIWIFDNIVMSIGIFIAILVTASVIPEMLEPGSLNLLLSKPVHRWGLLIAKFVGGCAFILVCAVVFFGGIWLWLGIQLGMWESVILYSIPIYLVVFAMYYAVSVLAGIWFRSPILCITFAVLFWAICFAIGMGYGRLNNWFYNVAPAELVATGNGVMYVDLQQNNRFWNDSRDNWETVTLRDTTTDDMAAAAVASLIIRLDELPDLPGPAWDVEGGRILASDAGFPAGPSSRTEWLSVDRQPGWTATAQGQYPAGTQCLFAAGDSRVFAINRSGYVFETELQEPEDTDEAPATSDDPPDAGPGMLDRLVKSVTQSSEFSNVSDYEEPLDLAGTHAASLNEKNEIALYSRGQLVILGRNDDNQFQILRTAPLDQQENLRMTAHVQFRGNDVFVMFGNGRFFHVAADTLKTVWEGMLDNRNAVRTLTASPDGRFAAVTFRNGHLWMYDAERPGESGQPGLGGQGDIMTATFDLQGRLWTGDRFCVARAWDPEQMSQLDSRQPPSEWLTRGFQLVIRPLYRMFPKPGEFERVLTRLSSSGDTLYNPEIDLTKQPQSDDPWQPLRSGVVFMLVTLGISCWIFQRTDY